MLDRDVEACLSIDPKAGRADTPVLSLVKDGVDRLQFIPGGTGTASRLRFLPPTGSGSDVTVSTAGALVFTPVAVTNKINTGRETAPYVTTRFETPTARVAASETLVFRGPITYAEFDVDPVPTMMLCDSTGKGWQYTITAAGTGFAAAVGQTVAQLQTNLGDNTWFRGSGRTMIGSERPGTRPGSLRVASPMGGAVELDWSGNGTRLRLMASNGVYYNITPDGTGALSAARVLELTITSLSPSTIANTVPGPWPVKVFGAFSMGVSYQVQVGGSTDWTGTPVSQGEIDATLAARAAGTYQITVASGVALSNALPFVVT